MVCYGIFWRGQLSLLYYSHKFVMEIIAGFTDCTLKYVLQECCNMLRAFWPGSLEKNNSMSPHRRGNKSQGCVNVGSWVNSEVNNYHLEYLTLVNI